MAKATATSNSATTMTTGEIRVSYPQIWQPKSFKGGNPKFSCILLIPKTDKATIQKIDACMNAAKIEGKTTKWKGIIPKSLDNPLHDGDEDFELEKKGEEFKGHYYLNAKSDNKPYVFDEKGEEILDQTQFYAGCYAKAAINFFPYDNASVGVGVGLNGLKKVRDGKPFTARPSAEKVKAMFDEDDDSEV